MSFYTTVLAVAAVVPLVSATLGITYPVSSTVCAGNAACGPFKWRVDDTIAPPAANFGPSTIKIYTGSVTQQTLFLDLGTIDDPSTVSEFPETTIPANLGPNGSFYFVRIESESATDPDTGYPLQAFSAKFSLTGMTGKLSASAQAQVDGTSVTTKLSTSKSTSTIKSTASKTTAASSTSGISSNSNLSKNTTGLSSSDSTSAATLPVKFRNMACAALIGVIVACSFLMF